MAVVRMMDLPSFFHLEEESLSVLFSAPYNRIQCQMSGRGKRKSTSTSKQ